MSRLKGWQKRLIYALDIELDKPFLWDSANCGDLMGAAVEACMGPKHPVLQHLQTGKSGPEVIAYVQQEGGLEGILGRYFEEAAWMMASNGDLALVKIGGIVAGGVVIDGKIKCKFEDADNVHSRNMFAFQLSKAYKVYKVE